MTSSSAKNIDLIDETVGHTVEQSISDAFRQINVDLTRHTGEGIVKSSPIEGQYLCQLKETDTEEFNERVELAEKAFQE